MITETVTELQLEIAAFIQHVKETYNPNKQLVFWIDTFCGAGGTSTGIHQAEQKNIYVAGCVNHDANAIKSHKENHPHTLHFTEDIRDFEVVLKLRMLVQELRKAFPGCIINFWASLECTNFSKAKGGMSRDADSRSLAEHMPMYLVELNPDFFYVENVREFMSWGPLDENGKPVSRTEGRDYIAWVENIKSHGYKYDKKILNAANYGAYQSRERLFIQFAKPEFQIIWPEQTHTKDKVVSGLFPMERWKPVREVLDLHDEGVSIFERKKPLSENTLKRIYAGLEKFVAKGDRNFIKKYYSGRPEGKVISTDGPAGTITTVGGQVMVTASHFIQQRYSGNESARVVDVDGPARTLTASGGNQEVVTASHLNTYYGNGGTHDIESPSPTVTTKDRISKIDVQFLLDYQFKSAAHDLDNPSPTLLTKDKFAKVDAHFIDQQYGNSKPASVELPLGTLTGNPKFALVNAECQSDPWLMNTNFNNVGKSIDEPAFTLTASRRHPYIVNANSSTSPPIDIENPSPSVTSRTHLLINPSWFGHPSATDGPSPTIIARQDKSPMYLMAVENGPVAWIVFEDDSETMIKIKEFMVRFGITDIKMRMLNIPELKQIQGFPREYKLIGTQTEQKKFIGNAVEVTQAKALIKSNYFSLSKRFKMAAA